MLSDWSDFDWCAVPPTAQQQWLSKPDNHLVLPWDYSIYGVYFNDRRYPMTLQAFRQAMAYLINRPQATQIADPNNVPDKISTGLLPPVAQTWLSKSDLAQLNPYNYNPAKATALLNSIGFKKTSAGWMMPNGKPLTLTLYAPAGWTSSVILMETIASEMKQFGFKDVTATSGEQPGYWSNQLNGSYDMSWGWAGWWTLDPIQEYYGTFVNQNYNPANPQEKGLGFGPSVKLKGSGGTAAPTGGPAEAPMRGLCPERARRLGSIECNSRPSLPRWWRRLPGAASPGATAPPSSLAAKSWARWW